MAITADQRAMLQLLLERRQSYEDIGSLLGLSTEEVRTRARATLTEIGGSDPDTAVGLTDFLLGQADPIGRADVARHLQNDADAHNLAEKLVTQLQVLAPGAELPALPDLRGKAASSAQQPDIPHPAVDAEATGTVEAPAPQATAPGSGRFDGIRDRQMQVIAALVAATVLVVAIVLGVSGVFDGDESSSPEREQAGGSDTEVPIKLSAPGGGTAKGAAVFTNTGGDTNQLAFRLTATGLKPTPADNRETYTIWLFVNAKNAYPLAPATVAKDGKLTVTRPIPGLFTSTQEGLAVLGRFREIRLSLTPTKELSALIAAAVNNQEPLVPYLGKTILEGKIPGSVSGSGGGTQTQPQPGGTQTQP